MRTRTLALLALAAAAFMVACTLALGADLASAQARAVALSDASYAPTTLRYVKAGASVTLPAQCARGGFYSDVSAYRWDARSLPAQRWNADRTVMRWGRVTFDGVTVRNGYGVPIIFAGWCEED